MKNKTTYEMTDIMDLITKNLAEKGLAPDPGTLVVRTREVAGGDFPVEVEIDVNVSWVGVPDTSPRPAQPASNLGAGRYESEDRSSAPPRDLLDEAPEPGVGPAMEIGSITAISHEITRANPGPFSRERVTRALLDGETTEYPGPSRTGGR
jgi:hypothetical protein